MKIQIKKPIFQAVLERAFGVAAKTSVNPVLQNVQCEVRGKQLITLGGDGTIYMESRTSQVSVDGPGMIVVSPRLLDVVKALPDAVVTMDVNDGIMALQCASYESNIRLESVEYPAIEIPKAGDLVQISKDDLVAALNRCKAALATESIKPAYQFAQVKREQMRATDGVRLHQTEFKYPIEALIPGKAVGEILRRCRSMAMDTVGYMDMDRSTVLVFEHDVMLLSKFVLEYPDVESQMLKPVLQNKKKLSLDRSKLLESVNRVGLMADEETSYLSLVLERNELELSAMDRVHNQAHETISVHWPHPRRKIGLNYEHLKDMLESMTKPSIEIWLHEDDNPSGMALFAEPGFQGVLFQLRVDLGEAARGSRRTRAAQSDPVGWRGRGRQTRLSEAIDANP